jgi:putative endonuclease
MPMNYVYILECADGTLYTGWTTDVEKRLQAHNAGEGAKYTRSRRPVLLRYAEICADKSTALRREAEIKRLTRAQKLLLIAGAQELNL